MADSCYYIARCNMEFIDSETESFNGWPVDHRFSKSQSFLNGILSDGCAVAMSPIRDEEFSVSFDLVIAGYKVENGWYFPSGIQDVLVPSGIVFCGTDKTYYVTSDSMVMLPGDWAHLLYRDSHLLPVQDLTTDIRQRSWNWLVDQFNCLGALDGEKLSRQCCNWLQTAPGIPSMAIVVQVMNACLGAERRRAQ